MRRISISRVLECKKLRNDKLIKEQINIWYLIEIMVITLINILKIHLLMTSLIFMLGYNSIQVLEE